MPNTEPQVHFRNEHTKINIWDLFFFYLLLQVYPTGRHYKLFTILHSPPYQVPLRVSGAISLASPSSDTLSPARRRISPVEGPPLTLFMHWRGGDEVAGNRELGVAQMTKYCRKENRKTVPNCVKLVDHDTFWDSEVWHPSNSKRHFSAYRDIALINAYVLLNLKERAQSDQTSNERQVVFSKILHNNELLFEQGRKLWNESCRRFPTLTKIRKKIPNPDTSRYLLTDGSVGWDESVKWYFQSISGFLGT